MDQTRSLLRVILPDAAAIAVVLLIQTYYSLFREPFFSGFFCDDESLRLPLLPQTVPSIVLNIVGIGSSIITVLIVELILKKDNDTSYTIGSYKIIQWQLSIYQMLMGFCFGAVSTHLLTTVGKKSIGRLRPHFWYTCRPNITESCIDVARYSYITNYVCQNTHKEAIRDIRVSFPSGHSSFSFYCAIFIIMYLQARWKGNNQNYLKSMVQFVCLLAAWFTSLSRVMDNKHHWSDVLAGMVLGTIMALLNAIFVMRLFRQTKLTKKSVVDGVNGDPVINMHNETPIQL